MLTSLPKFHVIKILSFLVLSAVLCQAEGAADKFDIAITSAIIKGNSVEFTMKIVNHSAGPVKVDISGDVTVVKAVPKGTTLSIPQATVRAGNYKPQFVVAAPADKLLFLPSKSSRVFAPKTLAPEEEFVLSSSIGVNPTALLKEAGVSSCEIFADLAYQDNAAVQHTAPSPTYKISKSPDDKLVLTPE
jgi:hypothetical protein